MKRINVLLLVALFLLALTLGFILGRVGENKGQVTERIRVETKVKMDTVKIADPAPVHDTIVKYVRVKMPIYHFRDSTKKVEDSADVSVPITQTVYSDSTYKAWVSGHLARLDSIEVYRKNTIITRTIEKTITKPPRRWGVGISVGVGYGATSKQIEPYIGIGATYIVF